MKKGFLILAFFGVMSSCFCQEIYYEVKADSTIFKDTIVFKNSFLNKKDEIATLKQGTKVKYSEGDDYSLFGFIDDEFFSVINVTTMNGEEGSVILDNLKLLSKNFMPKDIIDRRWICSYYYDILLSNTKETIFQYVPYWKNEWYTGAGEEWYEDMMLSYISISENAILLMGHDSCSGGFLITSSEKLEDGIKIELFIKDEVYPVLSKNSFLHHLKKGVQEMTLKIDGDYLGMYLDGSKSPLMIFARTDDYKGIDKKLEAIARGEKADLSDVTWPRHADGTCDYDDKNGIATASENQGMEESADAPATERAESTEKAAFPESAISKPAPAMGKTAVVTENLRLRTDDKTTAQVIATLAAGTRVKVLASGREDTIDGITSNWVQVSVLDGAKDKDGNAIETGTKGWLFGGYLSEAESVESEMANKEADAKESSALPIMPIAAGGAVLAVLLAVILFAVAKKRKASKK